MKLRDGILDSVRRNKPVPVSLPVVDMNKVIRYDDVVFKFKEILKDIGVQVIEMPDEHTADCFIDVHRKNGKNVVNVLNRTEASLENADARQLASVDLAIIRGAVAVAENGAVWIDERQMKNRLLPFICQHLVLLVYKQDIVATMHHAYKLIRIDKEGFGVFISGPSKTADIEQSLVIGAHGPVSMEIYLLEGTGKDKYAAQSGCTNEI